MSTSELTPQQTLKPAADSGQPSQVVNGAPNCPFPEGPTPPALEPCSYNECTQGHKWPAILALARCPGCTGAIIAVQKTNCPFCNEPTSRSVLRSDFVPRGAGVVARCQGQIPIGESLDVECQRTGWKAAEKETRTFLEQQEAERTGVKA